MRKRLYVIWFFVFLLSNWVVCVAHTANLKIEKTLTQADGLASNTVLTIFEDSHGNMWFGTADGLTRYDGENFRTFTTKDGLAANTIGLIFEDQQGMLWFCAGMLSSVLERGKTVDMSLMAMPLSELAEMSQENFIEKMASPVQVKSVSRYDGHEFRVFTTEDGLAYNTVKDIFEDKTGTLWFATSFGVSRYDGEKFNNIIVDGPMGMNILPESWNEVTAIAQDTAGNLWFGSTAGITYYNVRTSGLRYFDVDFIAFKEMGESQTGNVTDMQFDAKDNLWISQEGAGEESSGIRRYNGKESVPFPQSEELPMNNVDNITLDTNGNLWFSGVKRLPPTLHETEESVSMIYPEDGIGVSVYNGETFENFNTDDGLSTNRVRSVFEDSSGKLWFATDAGAAVGVYLPSQNADN